MDGEIQYVADTFLLERTFQVLAELDDSEGSLNKYAFDIGSVLGSIGTSIKNFVGGQVHGQDSGGAARTVVNFMAPAVFFRLHPILGILVTAGQLFGLDLYAIFQKITSAIVPKLESGQKVSAQEINSIAKASIPADVPMAVGASDDFLFPLRELEKKGKLTKEGIGSRRSNVGQAWKSTPFVPKSNNPLMRMFSFLGPRRGSSFIVGILVWFLKTVLLSAGLLAVGGAAAGALGVGKHPGSPKEKPTTTPGMTQPGAQLATTPVGIPAPTGAGAHNYRPKKGDMWVENLQGQQPHERVIQWALESYPSLNQYQDIIVRTPSFWNTVRGISQDWRPGQYQLVIPEPYKTRNEILAKFIPDVYRMVKQPRGMQ